MEMCIEATVDYTRERQAFGKSVLDNQYVHFRLAELQTEIELLRSLLYRVTAMYVHGEDATKLASMGKLKSGKYEMEFFSCTTLGIQVFPEKVSANQ